MRGSDDTYVRPKTPEFIKTLNTYSYEDGKYGRHSDDDGVPSGGTRGEDMEQRDAEMARQIHERDLAYAKGNQGDNADHQDLTTAVWTDADLARNIHERDLAYTKRNEGSDVGHQDPTTAVWTDAELARNIHERDLAYAKRNLGSEEDFGVTAPSTEQSDAEYARRLQERDFTYTQKELGSDVDPGGFGVGAATNTEQSDAEYARMLQERDYTYAQTRQNGDYEGAGAFGVEQSRPKLAHRVHERYPNAAEFQGVHHSSVAGPTHFDGSDARIAQELHEVELARAERLNRDKELALKLQAEEQAVPHVGGHSDYTPTSQSYYQSSESYGEASWKTYHDDSEKDSPRSTARYHQKQWQDNAPRLLESHQPIGGIDQPRQKIPPTTTTTTTISTALEKVSCQYCKELIPLESIHDHEVCN